MASTSPAKRAGESPAPLLSGISFLALGFVLVARRPAASLRRCNPPRVCLSSTTLLIFLAFFLLGNGLLCAGQVGSGRDEGEHSERTAVKETYKAYLSTWKGKDYSTLNRLLSNDYQAVDFQGIVTTKAHEIETAREDRTYDTLNADVMSIALFGESAVASGLIDASWENYRGSAQRITLRFIAMLPKQKRDWELVATESTKFSKAAAK